MKVIAFVLKLVSEALDGKRSDEDVARGLIDAAFDSGIAPSILLDHLTDKARARGELAADLAQWIKLGPKG